MFTFKTIGIENIAVTILIRSYNIFERNANIFLKFLLWCTNCKLFILRALIPEQWNFCSHAAGKHLLLQSSIGARTIERSIVFPATNSLYLDHQQSIFSQQTRSYMLTESTSTENNFRTLLISLPFCSSFHCSSIVLYLNSG